MAAKPKFWLQAATAKMERKGTVGAFGKASASKIAAGKAKGGLAAKRAVFAENAKRAAKGRSKSRAPKR